MIVGVPKEIKEQENRIGAVPAMVHSLVEAGHTVLVENEGGGDFTAPLPVVGGRLTYRVTPRLSVMATADFFFVSYDKYKGLLADVVIFASHRTFKHVGFGAGLDLQSLGVDIDDDDFLWEIQNRFVGYLVVVTFHF